MNTDTNKGMDKDSLNFKKSKDPQTNEHFLTLEKPMDLAQMEQNTHQPYSPLDSPFKVNQLARIIIFTQKKNHK